MRILLLAPLALMSSCTGTDAAEVLECEEYVVGKLKAPSSYKRIKADSTFMRSQSPPQVWVVIEYDAVNSYNAPIRDTQICKYPAKDGRAVTSGFIDHDAAFAQTVDNLEAEAFEAASNASSAAEGEIGRANWQGD